MPWHQLKIDTTLEKTEFFSDHLSELGAAAVTIEDAADQPLYEPPPGETPLWAETRVVGLFTEDTDMQQIIAQLKVAIAPTPLPPHHLEKLEDQIWEHAWMDDFKPMSFGKRVWICPSWCEPPEKDGCNIMLDPGLAFGTGTHPTTSLCLQWLDSFDAKGKSVIDFGCGSGILAIAAAKLGASPIWAVDNDPQAITATKENAKHNQVIDRIESVLPEDFTPQAVDLLLANILAGPIMAFAEQFSSLVKPGGHIVLSGILQEQAEEVREKYQACFELDQTSIEGDWVRITGTRR